MTTHILSGLDALLREAQHVDPMKINHEWFKERLVALKMSQRKLASRLRIDPASLSNMLAGKRRMTMEEAKSIAGHLLVPVTEVMRQAGSMFNLILVDGAVLENRDLAWAARVLWIQPT